MRNRTKPRPTRPRHRPLTVRPLGRGDDLHAHSTGRKLRTLPGVLHPGHDGTRACPCPTGRRGTLCRHHESATPRRDHVPHERPLMRVRGMEKGSLNEPARWAADRDVPVIRSLPDFDAFYEREFDAVAALAFVLSGSRLASDDLAQEAFIAAYRRWDEIGRYDNPGAWVRRVVANGSVSLVRRSVARSRALARLGGNSSEPFLEISTDTVDVWRAVRRLPRRQAQVIALFYLEDMSQAEVAEVLDCSVETIRTHLRRARTTLARRLTPLGDDHDI